MTRGREESEWLRVGMLCAVLANCHRGAKSSRVWRPIDFLPSWLKPEPPEAPFSILKSIFVDGKAR